MSTYMERSARSELEQVKRAGTTLADARARFGRKFADEPGSTWRPNAVPFLTRWRTQGPNHDGASVEK